MINLLRARAALAVVRMEMVDELAFDPDQLRDRRGRWVKDPRGAGGTPSLPRASAGGGAGAGGSAPSRRSPNPRDFGNFTPSNDTIWAQSEQRLGRRTPLTDPNGIKRGAVIPMDGGGWATVSQDPYTTPARKRGYVQIQADGEAYKRDYSMGLAQEMVRKNAAEREWRAAGGTREAFDRERESKAAAPTSSAVSEEPPAPKVNEYVPQHIREVQQYLSGERRAPLPLSYLYGSVGRESWEKHFTPEQRERVLGELLTIEAGMSEDARDRPRVTAAIEALQPLVPGDHQALAVKTAERFLADRQKALTSIEGAEFRDDEISQNARRAQIEYAAKQVADAEAVVSKLKKAASDKRAQADTKSRPGPEIGPDGKYTKPVKQYATWNGKTATRTSRSPYKYAAVVQVGDGEPQITSWHKTREAAQKGTLTKMQRENGVRVVAVAEVGTDPPAGRVAA